MTTINNALDNATQTPRWRYVAMVNTAYRVTTKVGMQWVGCESKINGGPHCPSGSSRNLNAKIMDGCTYIPTATSFMILFYIPRKKILAKVIFLQL